MGAIADTLADTTELRVRRSKIKCRQVKRLTHLPGIGELCVGVALAFAGGVRAVEGAKMTTNPLTKSVPRVEIDQRSREARLRIERIERLLVPRAAVTQSRLRSLRTRSHELSDVRRPPIAQRPPVSANLPLAVSR